MHEDYEVTKYTSLVPISTELLEDAIDWSCVLRGDCPPSAETASVQKKPWKYRLRHRYLEWSWRKRKELALWISDDVVDRNDCDW